MSLGAAEDTKARRYYGDRAGNLSRRRSYCDTEKAAALELLATYDGNVARTADELGIARVSLLSWQQEAEAGRLLDVERLRPLIRKVLDEECEAAAREFIAAARLPEKVEKAGTLQLMTSAGIAIDKMRLLREQATSIHTQQLSDEERIARLNELLATALTLPAAAAEEQSEEQPALPAAALEQSASAHEQPDADDCS
jgi:transposase-like protein